MIEFDVAKEFTPYPGGRKMIHGPHSGEEFLLRHLVPFWEEFNDRQERIRLDFENCMGATCGFLDESFGELAMLFGKREVLHRFSIVGKHTVEDEIDGVLSRAEKTGKFRTPELDKIRDTKTKRETIQDFMDWCESQEPSLHLAQRDLEDKRGFMVNDVDWKPWCTKWLGIDEQKAEQERMLVLEQIRAMNDLSARSKTLLAKRGTRR